MTTTVDQWRAKQAAADQKRQYRNNYGNTKSEWVTIDGEGWGRDETGRQHYRFMIAANESGFQMKVQHSTRESLTTEQALEWLVSIPYNYRLYCERIDKEYHPPLIGGFALGYDYSHILIDITKPQLDKLLTESSYELPPMWITDKYGVKLTAGNLRIYVRESEGIAYREELSIWDSYKYYQAAFLKVMKAYADDSQWHIIEAGKGRRDADAEHDINDEIMYCLSECRVHSRAMNDLSRAVHEMNLHPRGWYGPGSLAQSAMTKHGVKAFWKSDDEQESGLAIAAMHAYIGGRFETTGHGWVPKMYGHDIRSAYPAAMINLPCLAHGEWIHVTGLNAQEAMDHSALAVGLCEWHCSNPLGGWGPYPTRSVWHHDLSAAASKLPAWPFHGKGWIWSEEYRAGRFLTDSVECQEAWFYQTRCRCVPFDWVPDYYDLRRELKEEGNEIGEKVIKLVINSLYGKIAQSIGKPPVPTWIWAGLITQSARSKLLDAIKTTPENCIMVATDAIYSTEPLVLNFGPNLGQWDGPDEYGRTLIIQAGFWKDYDSDNEKHQKTRGIAKRYLEHLWPSFSELWSLIVDQNMRISDAIIPVRYSDHIGLQRARQYGIDRLGRWTDDAYQNIRFRVDKRPHLIGSPINGWWKSAPTRTDRIGEQLEMNLEVTVGEQYIADERTAMDRYFIVEQPDAAEWGYDD